jgi:hypothetical protein
MTPRWRRVACAAHVVPAENNPAWKVRALIRPFHVLKCQGLLLRCVRAHSVGLAWLACSQLEPFFCLVLYSNYF